MKNCFKIYFLMFTLISISSANTLNITEDTIEKNITEEKSKNINISNTITIEPASDDELVEAGYNNNKTTDGEQMEVEDTKKAKKIESPTATKEDMSKAYLLYALMKYGENSDNKTIKTGTKTSYFSAAAPETDNHTEKKNESTDQKEKSEQSKSPSAPENQETIYITATCETDRDYDVTNESLVEIYCESKRFGIVSLYTLLAPSLDNNKLPMLKGEPLYFIDLKKGQHYRFNTETKLLVNKYSGNKNIATWVNEHKTQKWAKQTSIYAATATSNAVKEYMEEDKQSKATEELATDTEGNIVKAINTEAPKLVDKLVPTSIDIVVTSFKNWLNASKDKGPMFKIKRKTTLKLYGNVVKVED